MTKTLTILYRASQHHRERVFAVLIAAIVFTACTYVFLLQKAIINVVQREKVSKSVTSASMAVNDLEARYFSLKDTVTLELAHSKGLKDAEVTAYISKKSLTAMAK
ncbi:MAG: hypothetical protein Q8Q03_00655 [bacterium]|nr:hypothetical protein [bacterium]